MAGGADPGVSAGGDPRVTAGALRAFLALPLPERLAGTYVALQRDLERVGSVKWVERANLHVTLKFLGEVERTGLPALIEQLGQAGADAEPGSLGPGRLTAFPTARAARILVVELTDVAGAVGRLHAAIEDRLVRAGLARDDRPFRAHLTLGRLRRGPVDARRALAELPGPEGGWRVGSFELMESRLGPGGPAYTTLQSFDLGRVARPSREREGGGLSLG